MLKSTTFFKHSMVFAFPLSAVQPVTFNAQENSKQHTLKISKLLIHDWVFRVYPICRASCNKFYSMIQMSWLWNQTRDPLVFWSSDCFWTFYHVAFLVHTFPSCTPIINQIKYSEFSFFLEHEIWKYNLWWNVENCWIRGCQV